MQRYNTRLLNKEEHELVLNFTWDIAQKREFFYFPYFKSKEEVHALIHRFFEQEGLYLIGIFEEKSLVAVFPLVFRAGEEIGMWDKGIYIENQKITYETAMNHFKQFIKVDLGFGSKKIYCGINSDYQEARAYYTKEQSVVIEESYITNHDFMNQPPKCGALESNVMDLEVNYLDLTHYRESLIGFSSEVLKQDKFFDTYFKYHDKAYAGYYWSAERMKKHVEDFRIIIAYSQAEKEQILISGAIFVREIEGVGDVYGLSDGFNEDDNQAASICVRENLLCKAMENGYKDGLKSMMYFAEESSDYELAQRMGFEPLGKYTVYLWAL